jgi:MoaA/NifB/PqqE/SkfB family radical SAM enzyme
MKTLYIYLNNECNNSCRFCATGIIMENVYAVQGTDYFRGILETEKERHDGAVFTGGEPTLSRDLPELARYAKVLGYEYTELQTNGRLFFYPAFARKIAESGIEHFVINICGHAPKIHDYATRVPGSLKQTVGGIRNLLKLNKDITAYVVITKTNYKYLEHICNFLFGMGIMQVKLSFVEPAGYAYINFRDVVPRLSDIYEYLDSAMLFAKRSGIRILTEGIPYCFLKGHEECVSEILEDSGAKDLRAREDKAKPPQCRGCTYNAVCEGLWKAYLMKFGENEVKPQSK